MKKVVLFLITLLSVNYGHCYIKKSGKKNSLKKMLEEKDFATFLALKNENKGLTNCLTPPKSKCGLFAWDPEIKFLTDTKKKKQQPIKPFNIFECLATLLNNLPSLQ